MQVSDIKKAAQVVLNDADVAWTADNMRTAVTNAVSAIAMLKPESCRETYTFQLLPGILQSVPAGYRRILGKFMENMGSDGLTQGQSVVHTDMDTLDQNNPTWRTETPATTIYEFMYDENSPDEFYVSPPVHGSTPVYVAANLAKEVTAYTADSNVLPLNEAYRAACVEYVLYFLFARDSMETPNWQRGQAHLKNFYQLLGIKTQADRTGAIRAVTNQ